MAPNSIKNTFLDSSKQYLLNDIYLFDFMEARIFHCFSNEIISYFGTFKFAYLVKHNTSYQFSMIQVSMMSGSNFTEIGENTLPQPPPSPIAVPGEKSPVLLGLKTLQMFVFLHELLTKVPTPLIW